LLPKEYGVIQIVRTITAVGSAFLFSILSSSVTADVSVDEVRAYIVSIPRLLQPERTRQLVALIERLEVADPAEAILELTILLADRLYTNNKSAPKLPMLLSSGLALAQDVGDGLRVESFSYRQVMHAKRVDAYSPKGINVTGYYWEVLERQRSALKRSEMSEMQRMRHFSDAVSIFMLCERQRGAVQFLYWAKYAVKLTDSFNADWWFLSVEAKRQLALTYAELGWFDQSKALLQQSIDLIERNHPQSGTLFGLRWAYGYVLSASGDYERSHLMLSAAMSTRMQHARSPAVRARLELQNIDVGIKREAWADVEKNLKSLQASALTNESSLRAKFDAVGALWSIHVGDFKEAERMLDAVDVHFLNPENDEDVTGARENLREARLRLATLRGDGAATTIAIANVLRERGRQLLDSAGQLGAVAHLLEIEEKTIQSAHFERDKAMVQLAAWQVDSHRQAILALLALGALALVGAGIFWLVNSGVRTHDAAHEVSSRR
jgi:tetratricopeptide (TPR) repeat protein